MKVDSSPVFTPAFEAAGIKFHPEISHWRHTAVIDGRSVSVNGIPGLSQDYIESALRLRAEVSRES
jgi:hypothetical protein